MKRMIIAQSETVHKITIDVQVDAHTNSAASTFKLSVKGNGLDDALNELSTALDKKLRKNFD